jgi:hypothetical protein
MKSKYIILKCSGLEVPLVFSPMLIHADVARGKKVRSAGFCELGPDGRWVVGGDSTSLKLSSRPQDAAILNTHLEVYRR